MLVLVICRAAANADTDLDHGAVLAEHLPASADPRNRRGAPHALNLPLLATITAAGLGGARSR